MSLPVVNAQRIVSDSAAENHSQFRSTPKLVVFHASKCGDVKLLVAMMTM